MKTRKFYQLNPSLTFRRNEDRHLLIGELPPHSFSVSDADADKLEKFLRSAKGMMSEERVIESLNEAGFENQSEGAFNDLINHKVLIRALDSQDRYHRHELYFELASLEKSRSRYSFSDVFRKKSVALIGVGGIGSQCAQLLNAAGIGQITLIDADRVEKTNLTRAVLFEESDIGDLKVRAAKRRLLVRNSETLIKEVKKTLSLKNREELVRAMRGVDFAILSADGAETFETALSICTQLNIPFITAGYIEICGVVGPIITRENKSFALAEAESSISSSESFGLPFQAPSYGPLNAIVSSIAVNECLRYLLGLKTETSHKRILIDSTSYEIWFQTEPHTQERVA